MDNEDTSSTPLSGTTPPASERATTPPKANPVATAGPSEPPTTDAAAGFIGSPLKKQRASVSAADENALRRRIAESSGRINEILGTGSETKPASFGEDIKPDSEPIKEDEEL